MTDLLTAAKAVIDRWDAHHVVVDGTLIADLRVAVERADQGPENEPVAWLHKDGKSTCTNKSKKYGGVDNGYSIPLYRHPPRPTGLDQLLERIRFLEQQIAERKNQ